MTNAAGTSRRIILLMLLPALLFLVLLFVYPFFFAIYMSFTEKGGSGFSLANYVRFFTDEWEFRIIGVTLSISLPVTILCVVLAVPFAYFMRSGLKHEKIVTFFLIIPITLGTVLIAQGMRTFYGTKGWFNLFLISTGILSEPLKLVPYNSGVIVSLFIQGFPFAFLMMLGYTSGINPDLEKAAMMLGASKWQTFWKVMFPLMAPGIAIAFCLNFVMSFSLFPSAVMLGQPAGNTRVIAYAAWQWTYEKYNVNMGSAICVIMAVIEITIISIVLAWRSRMYKGSSIVGKG